VQPLTAPAAARGTARAAFEALSLAALGALQTLAFVHTAAWWLPIATLALLVWRLDAASPRRAALLGWCYGTAWLCAGVWWLFVSMHRYGGLPAPLAAAAVFALSLASGAGRDSVRTNLLFMSPDKPFRRVVVTSSCVAAFRSSPPTSPVGSRCSR
jgi:hypothetical protein